MVFRPELIDALMQEQHWPNDEAHSGMRNGLVEERAHHLPSNLGHENKAPAASLLVCPFSTCCSLFTGIKEESQAVPG